jgi:hypothetical protein
MCEFLDKSGNLMSNLGGIKMGNPEEIVEAMRNRRISKKIGEKIKTLLELLFNTQQFFQW